MTPRKTALFGGLTLAVAALVFVFFSFLSSPKIAYVDSGKLMAGYRAMVEARKEFEKKQTTWKANVDSLTNDVKESITKYNKTIAMGSAMEQKLAKELISSKQKQLYEYQQATQQNAAQEEQRLTQSVLTTVNAFLLRYGKKNGYKLILIAAGGNIAYADADMDITDKIVEELNKEYSVPVK
jgi:outer membrane protein